MKFSIVIAVAPKRSAEVISSLKNVCYPKNKYEVIIEVGKNPSENRNKGAKNAKGEIIGFIDDDAMIDKEILKKAEEFFEKYRKIDIVGGPQLTPIDDKGFARISGYALSSIFGVWKISNRYSGKKLNLEADETMLTSANMFCRKKVFKKIKFNPQLFPGEDPDFISQAIKKSMKVAYSPEIKVYHRRRASFFGFAKQIYNYGKTRPKKESIIETLKMPFFIIPSIFLLYMSLLIILALFNKLNFIILLPILAYIVLDIIFTVANALINQDILSILILPLIYPLIHLSYGLGFLVTTIKKLFKGK